MNTDNMIRLPDDFSLTKFIQEVYSLSRPHHEHGAQGCELSEREAARLLSIFGQRCSDQNAGSLWHGAPALSIDHIAGRACKMDVFWSPGETPDDKPTMWIYADVWYGHTQKDLDTLLQRCGLRRPTALNDMEGAK